jgi:UrcA family protein
MAATLLSSQALAGDDSTLSVRLRLDRVNYDDPRQVQALYAHIKYAARQACVDPRDAAFMPVPTAPDCVDQVMTEVMAKIGQPRLTALYKNEGAAPTPRVGLAGNDQ